MRNAVLGLKQAIDVSREEVTAMKKLISYITVLGFVFAFGLAYADDHATRTSGRSAAADDYTVLAMENGISVFDTRAVSYDDGHLESDAIGSGADGSGAGGYAAWEPGKEVGNGITIFSTGPVSYDSGATEVSGGGVSAEGSAAGGLSDEGPGMKVENGITIFDTAPVDSN